MPRLPGAIGRKPGRRESEVGEIFSRIPAEVTLLHRQIAYLQWVHSQPLSVLIWDDYRMGVQDILPVTLMAAVTSAIGWVAWDHGTCQSVAPSEGSDTEEPCRNKRELGCQRMLILVSQKARLQGLRPVFRVRQFSNHGRPRRGFWPSRQVLFN